MVTSFLCLKTSTTLLVLWIWSKLLSWLLSGSVLGFPLASAPFLIPLPVPPPPYPTPASPILLEPYRISFHSFVELATLSLASDLVCFLCPNILLPIFSFRFWLACHSNLNVIPRAELGASPVGVANTLHLSPPQRISHSIANSLFNLLFILPNMGCLMKGKRGRVEITLNYMCIYIYIRHLYRS